PSSTHIDVFSLRPQPTATLFPYTTLFRSIIAIAIDIDSRRTCNGRRGVLGQWQLGASHARSETLLHVAARITRREMQDRVRIFGDRKSTRLNSSHEWISYAVFCLKKKKKV